MKKKMPTPKLTPSGMYRIQLMVKGKKLSITDADPARCQALAAAARADILAGIAQRKQDLAGCITLGDAVDRYIADRSNVLSASTLRGYKDIREHHLTALMPMQVRDIDEALIQAHINREAKTMSQKTLSNVMGLIAPAMAPYRPIDKSRIRLPRKIKKEKAIMEADDMIRLMEAIRGELTEIPILLAIWLGLRRSEILGLCWDSVDIKGSRITVRRGWVKGEDGFVLQEFAKTDESWRILDCPGYIMSKLEQLRPDPAARTGRIFPLGESTIYNALRRVCKRNAITFVGLHGLRHTNASVMAHLDVLDRVTMALGGWSTDVTMKQVYTHVFKSDKQDAVERRDKYFDSIAQGIRPKKE